MLIFIGNALPLLLSVASIWKILSDLIKGKTINHFTYFFYFFLAVASLVLAIKTTSKKEIKIESPEFTFENGKKWVVVGKGKYNKLILREPGPKDEVWQEIEYNIWGREFKGKIITK